MTAAHARYLAHRAGTTWRRVLTDPTSGTVLDIGRIGYRPPEAPADLVRTRYGGRCTRPGCAHRAADLDHALDWKAGGGTSESNLHPVCRGCHTAKHHSATTSQGWTITLHDDQSVTWTAPHGHPRTSYPTDHRPEDRGPVPVGAPPDPAVFEPPPFCGTAVRHGASIPGAESSIAQRKSNTRGDPGHGVVEHNTLA
jgi:hypothetical protein